MGFKLTGEYHIDCSMLLKQLKGLRQPCTSGAQLVAGKTYVFKDEESKQEYFSSNSVNHWCMENYYREGFKLDRLDVFGNGLISEYPVMLADEMKFFKLKEENVMPIKPEDEVTITTTYRELAVCYAVLGKIHQGGNEESLWSKLKGILDPEQKVYNALIYEKDFYKIVKYNEYSSVWESLLFPQKLVETQQIQIRELREQVEALLQKTKELEGTK